MRILNFREMMVRRWMIEELRERESDFVEPRPIQIAKHDTLLCFLLCQFNQPDLRGKIRPSLTIVNYSIDPSPKLRIHRLAEFLLPPKVERQIRIQM